MVTTSKLININVNNVIFIMYMSKRFNKIKIINIFDKPFFNLFKVLWICIYQFDFVFCRNKYEPHSELSDKNVRLSYRFVFSKIVSWSILYVLLLIITTNNPFLLCHGLFSVANLFWYTFEFGYHFGSFPSIFTQKIPQKTILLKIWIAYWKLKNSYLL